MRYYISQKADPLYIGIKGMLEGVKMGKTGVI